MQRRKRAKHLEINQNKQVEEGDVDTSETV